MSLTVVSSSGGAVQVAVPDVTTKTEAEAKAALGDFTVRVRKVKAAGAAGTVFAQDPEADTVRPRRSTVTIFVIVDPVLDDKDVVKALTDLKTSVDTLGTTALETEADASTRHDEILERLKEIKDGLPYGEALTSKSSTPSKTTS